MSSTVTPSKNFGATYHNMSGFSTTVSKKHMDSSFMFLPESTENYPRSNSQITDHIDFQKSKHLIDNSCGDPMYHIRKHHK